MLAYNNLTNEELFKLMADKDQGVVQYIYDKYSPAIYGIIVQKIRFRKEAEAILIDTFISFFKEQSYSRFSKKSIFITLYNIAFDYIRKGNVFYLSHPAIDIPNVRRSSTNDLLYGN